MTYDYEWFKKQIYTITTIDLGSYKEKQMKRRIDTLIGKYKITGYENFIALLKKDKDVLNSFIAYLTINVSEFFRNREQWDLMNKDMIPVLTKRFGQKLKIWSAACSTGDEPYTIVMLLSRHMPLSQISVLATDIDLTAIAKAKNGVYEAKEIANVPDDLKKKFFTKEGDKFKISNEVKSRANFRKADLLRDPYPTDYHLIVCRNVMIYFTEEAKDDIYRKFYKALAPEGVLFIGSTEQIINYKDIGYLRASSYYYERPGIKLPGK